MVKIVCFSCRSKIAARMPEFKKRLAKHMEGEADEVRPGYIKSTSSSKTAEEVFISMNIYRECCRTEFLTHVDFYDLRRRGIPHA